QFERYLRRAGARNAGRRRALIATLRECFGRRVEIAGENTGVHLVVWLNDVPPRDLLALIARAARAGGGDLLGGAVLRRAAAARRPALRLRRAHRRGDPRRRPPAGRGALAEPAHLADDLPFGLGHRLHRQTRDPHQGHAGEAPVRLDLIEADRRRQLLHRGDVDGRPGGVGRVGMRFRDHLHDPDDRALFSGVVEERLLALLHGPQVIARREVADAGPLRALTPLRDLLVPRPVVRLGLHQPVRHGPNTTPGPAGAAVRSAA